MNNENFKKLISKTPSKWRQKAQERINQPWLTEYSAQIARRIKALIKYDEELNQTKLATAIGSERQYISRIIQGKENLSLQTIWKLSKALEFDLIKFPDYQYNNNSKIVDSVKSNIIISEPYLTLGKKGHIQKPVETTSNEKILISGETKAA